MSGDNGSTALDASYAHCVAVTKEQAKNFHWAFERLPPEPYRGICAMYAFARLADDYSDDESDPQRALENAQAMHRDLDRALAGDLPDGPLWPAVAETVKRCRIDPKYLHELIRGTELDAAQKRCATWDETRNYCYLVASVIGIMTIHVFGFTDENGQALKLAEETGIAFQMTNILRDIKEDAARGRIYLPLEDLARFGVSEDEVLAAKDGAKMRALVKFEYERARACYEAAPRLVPMIDAPCRPALEALVEIYRRLLEKIPEREYDVLSERIGLSKLEKISVAGRFALKSALKR